MRSISGNIIIKQKNRIKIAMYILNHNGVSRQEISNALGYSMPTVFQNVSELIEMGLIFENGEYASTGGRKAKTLSIKEGFFCSIGIEITPHHVRMILMDLSRRILKVEHKSFVYEDTTEYYTELGNIIKNFIIENNADNDSSYHLIGVGIAIPGIIDQKKNLLIKSHALKVENVALWQFSQNIPYKVIYGNDANFAAYTEVINRKKNTIYLSLNDTVGGAIYQNGKIFLGDNFKSGEIGHMILVPNGKKCYCGKRGCLDAYCSAKVLRKHENDYSLGDFFNDVENDEPHSIKHWDKYLDHLAIMVSNLRMAYDCDIIIGGHVGGYMSGYMRIFSDKIRKYNNFEADTSYILLGKYKSECAAIGAARIVSDNFIENLGEYEKHSIY